MQGSILKEMSSRAALGEAIRRRRIEASVKTLGLLSQRLRDYGLTEGISIGHLSEVERGNTWPSPKLVRALDAVLSTKGELIGLLREAKVPHLPVDDDQASELEVTAHLFYPLRVETVPELPEVSVSTPYDFLPRLGCHEISDSVQATLHSFPFNVIVLHEKHLLPSSALSDIALWRQEQLERAGVAVVAHGESLGASITPADHEPYCFSAFVSPVHPIDDEVRQLRTNQLLAMPGILISENREERVESLMTSPIPVTDIFDFSLTGSHFGSATWAAVSISLQNGRDTHSITNALVELEVQLQAFWCYASNVEAGGAIPRKPHDARFLQRVVGKLNCPWPNEHTAHRRLREALVSTSRVVELVKSAIGASV